MEASGAGLAAGGGDGAAQGQGDGGEQQDGQQGQATGDAAIAQLAEGLARMESGQEEMRRFLGGIAEQQQGTGQEHQAQQEQHQQQPQPLDLSVFDETAPGYDGQKAAELLQNAMSQTASTEAGRLLQEAIGPLQQQVTDMRRSQETDALTAEFPDLKDEKVAESVVASAQRYATMVGQPELVTSTPFVRLVYMAGRAAELAQKQGGAADGATAATLEGATGASPGSAAQGATTQEALAQAWGQRSDVMAKL